MIRMRLTILLIICGGSVLPLVAAILTKIGEAGAWIVRAMRTGFRDSE